MKAKALQFGKAMSAALFVLLLVVVGSKNALAQTQVATLQHGDTISAYYGANAFAEANAAAADGDIITLSGGTFTSGTITKAITLRGAGCYRDSIVENFVTTIPGDVYITTSNVSVEGVYFSGNLYYYNNIVSNLNFIRCNINNFINGRWSGSDTYGIKNSQFVNCLFLRCSLDGYSNGGTTNNTFINCVIGNLTYAEGSQVCYNSIIKLGTNAPDMSAYNCVVISNSNTYFLHNNSIAYNSIGIKTGSGSTPVFNTIPTFDCMAVTSYDAVFESFAGTFSFDELYLLKDEIATGFLGNDGTEIGIHGGFMPYSVRPIYMVPMRCNVANKSTIDGKLSVDIEVITVSE